MTKNIIFLLCLVFFNTMLSSEQYLDLAFWQKKISQRNLEKRMDVLVVEEIDDNSLMLSLVIYNEDSIDFATQEVIVNDEGIYNFGQINKNGCGYRFDLENPTSPIIRIRKPSQEGSQEYAIEEEVGFVPFGDVNKIYCQNDKVPSLVIPFAQPFNRFKSKEDPESLKIHRGNAKITIPAYALQATHTLKRHNSLQSDDGRSSSENCDRMASSTDTQSSN